MGFNGRRLYTSSEIATCSHGVAQQSVHLTGGYGRVFKQFSWLWVFPVSAASPPSHQRVTHTIGRSCLILKDFE